MNYTQAQQVNMETVGGGGISSVSATANVDSNVGTPSVEVSNVGTDENPIFDFSFKNLKGASGSTDYSSLTNKPQINAVELTGNKSASDLGLVKKNGDIMTGNLTIDRPNGTAGTEGTSYIILGNNIPRKDDKNSSGRIRIFGRTSTTSEAVYYAQIYTATLTANRNFILPNKAGTFAMTTDVAVKAVSKVTMTLSKSAWSSSQYSLESTYPKATYNITVEPNGDSITETQYNAFVNAKIAWLSTSNVMKAIGTVPTVDIPVILHLEKIA